MRKCVQSAVGLAIGILGVGGAPLSALADDTAATPAPMPPPKSTTAEVKSAPNPVIDPMVAGAEFLESHSWMTLGCPSGNVDYDPNRRAVRLKETCRMSIGWVAKHVSGNITFLPREFRIRAVGASDSAFSYALNQSYAKYTFTEEWYTAERFQFGKEYAADIVYDVYAAGTQTPISQEAVRVFKFKPVKNRFAFQVTPKVFTAWEISDDGDRSYLVPAISFGGAVRTADDYNNLDVFAIRLMAGAGPNLIADSELQRDMDGTVVGIKNRQKIQVIAGAEVVFWRYLSAGLAWVPFGRDKSSTPLVLLSYGELYPAVVNTP